VCANLSVGGRERNRLCMAGGTSIDAISVDAVGRR
jgi:hypothetical protein